MPIQIKRHSEKLDITTPRLIISLVFRPFNVRVYDHEGHLLTQDNPKCSATVKGESIQVHRKIPPGTPVLGLGDQHGEMDRAGKLHPFEMQEASKEQLKKHENPQIVFPVFFYKGKDHAVGIFLDNPQKAKIDLRGVKKGDYSLETENKNLDYYILIGEDFEEVSRSLSLLIGNSAFPPRWSLEIMKGLESKLEKKPFLDQFNKVREEFLLTSSLITHQPDKDPTGFWDERPLNLLKSFRRSDEIPHFLLEMNQSMKLNDLKEDEREELVHQGAFIETELESGKAKVSTKKKVVLDPFYDAGHDFLSRKLKPLLSKDLRGIEINDPYPHWDCKNINDAKVRCIQEIIAEDGESVEKLVHYVEAKNLLGYMPNGLIQNLFRFSLDLQPEQRPLIVTTSGYAGVQRYAVLRLMHESLAWKDLIPYLSRILSLNISGAPLICADIEISKGFDEELISQQIMMLSFVPLIRLKLSKGHDLAEILESETFIDTLEYTFQLRESWLPYLYQLTCRSHEEGLPILNPVLYCFPEWDKANKATDQFLVGSHVMVAPFVKAKASQRTVELPPGLWADANTFSVIEGPASITVEKGDAPLPMFFREGAMVPTYDTSSEIMDRTIVVTFFPKPELISEADLYDDDGDSNKYQSQQRACVQMKLSGTKKGYVLKLSRRQGRMNPSWSSYLLRFIHSRLDIQRVVYNRTELTYFTSIDELCESKMGFFLDDELEMLFIKVPYEREGGVIRF